MDKVKKIVMIVAGVVVALLIIGAIIFFSRSSTQRSLKDFESEYSGGLDRIVNVYSYDGKKLASYEGRIDVAENVNGTVKFELKGRRYIYYNALVEVIEK